MRARAQRTATLRHARAALKATPATNQAEEPQIAQAAPKRSGTPPAARVTFADTGRGRSRSPLPTLEWDQLAATDGAVREICKSPAKPSISPNRKKGKGKGKGAHKGKAKGKGKPGNGKAAGQPGGAWRKISLKARKDGGAAQGGKS